MLNFRQPNIPAKLLIMLAALLLFTGADLLIKDIVHQTLRGSREIVVIPGFWSFRYTINHNLGFSLLQFLDDMLPQQQKYILLLCIQGLATAAVTAFVLLVKKWKHILPLMLIICGGMGNFIDRIIHGGVVDYILWYYGDFSWPIFNLADVYSVVGIILFVVILYFFSKERTFKALIRPKKEEECT
jgi:signal peptidase II